MGTDLMTVKRSVDVVWSTYCCCNVNERPGVRNKDDNLR